MLFMTNYLGENDQPLDPYETAPVTPPAEPTSEQLVALSPAALSVYMAAVTKGVSKMVAYQDALAFAAGPPVVAPAPAACSVCSKWYVHAGLGFGVGVLATGLIAFIATHKKA
jgi:hypothetical protein